jgi:CRISPR-associated protein Cas2
MLVLVTYDVNTQTDAGKRRLRRVAKICENHGQRVQNSVFECVIDAAQLAIMKCKLEKEMNVDEDSLRFYNLGNNHKAKVGHMGAKPSFDVKGPLFV